MRRRSRPPRAPTVGIWGHYHGRNLGDELVVATIVDALRRRLPEARAIGISMAPEDTCQRHGIAAFPIDPGMPGVRPRSPAAEAGADVPRATALRRVARHLPGARRVFRLLRLLVRIGRELPFSLRALSLLRRLDVVVVAGSGQLLDQWRGPFGHPYTLFRWACLARMAGVPILYPSVGAGPIDHALSRLFIRSALAPSPYVSVRDRSSAEALRAAGVRRRLPSCPDMGYAYRRDGEAKPNPCLPPGRGSVGLNAIAHRDPRYWPRGSGADFTAYLAKMTEFAEWLLERGCTVTLFSSQVSADAVVADDLRAALAHRGMDRHPCLRTAFTDIETVADLVQVVKDFDVVVAGRYHSVLLPILLGIPTLGLAYHPKTKDLLHDLDLDDRCLDIDTFTPAELERRFLALADESADRGKAIADRVAARRSQVEVQFDSLFGVNIDGQQ